MIGNTPLASQSVSKLAVAVCSSNFCFIIRQDRILRFGRSKHVVSLALVESAHPPAVVIFYILVSVLHFSAAL